MVYSTATASSLRTFTATPLTTRKADNLSLSKRSLNGGGHKSPTGMLQRPFGGRTTSTTRVFERSENSSAQSTSRLIGEAKREARRQRRGMAKGNTSSEGQLTALIEQLHNHDPLGNDVVTDAIQGRVAEFISPDEYDDNIVKELWELYYSYVSELRTICADHTLSHERSAMLTEEEVVVSFRPIPMNVTGHRR